ncbi:GntR family transcriptional regulator [Arthrobacter sulfonylureivorans]|uniref:GntR family transcriptional regulator n=1 Tax=Arthrobacter sulfonylureivorans TaxID=2486855 RepID=A0ABY3W9V7_9MICC|nr:GntR family transcriptional regulator [Arthrobacter sulfonylureivorans]UNK47110.1 GntR family transcriptional regulator [Arthrobacter sulfonylureivorans]
MGKIVNGESRSLSSDVYSSIRQLVFSGQLEPGRWIQLGALSDRLEVSKTVIREVLSTLVGEGLLELIPGRGFRVAEFSPSELPELTEVRCLVETYALKKSVDKGDVDWEARLIAAHHRMSREPRRASDDDRMLNQEWARLHAEFHWVLISNASVPALQDFCRKLAAMFDICRLQIGPELGARDVEDEHREIVAAVLERDADRAGDLLARHYRETTHHLLQQWEQSQKQLGVKAE